MRRWCADPYNKMATNTARRKSSLSRIRRLSGSLGGKGLIDPTTLECTAARRQSELTVEDEAELAELEQELELLEQQLADEDAAEQAAAAPMPYPTPSRARSRRGSVEDNPFMQRDRARTRSQAGPGINTGSAAGATTSRLASASVSASAPAVNAVLRSLDLSGTGIGDAAGTLCCALAPQQCSGQSVLAARPQHGPFRD